VTVVAALVADGRVWMAADSLAIDGQAMTFPSPHKAHRLDIAHGTDHVIVGAAGRAAVGHAIRHRLKIDAGPDPLDDDDANAWAYSIAEAFTELCLERKLVNDDGGVDGEMLLGWRGRLWDVSDHLALPLPTFGGIGSGAAVARGALDVLADQVNVTPDWAVTRAAEAACRHNAQCRPPITVVCT
jgi:ATP-dependent protease HslVU (ClpYQ) peptidase subunit